MRRRAEGAEAALDAERERCVRGAARRPFERSRATSSGSPDSDASCSTLNKNAEAFELNPGSNRGGGEGATDADAELELRFVSAAETAAAGVLALSNDSATIAALQPSRPSSSSSSWNSIMSISEEEGGVGDQCPSARRQRYRERAERAAAKLAAAAAAACAIAASLTPPSRLATVPTPPPSRRRPASQPRASSTPGASGLARPHSFNGTSAVIYEGDIPETPLREHSPPSSLAWLLGSVSLRNQGMASESLKAQMRRCSPPDSHLI